MRGTEKQIKWATEIRANVINTMESVIAYFTPLAATDPVVRQNVDCLNACIERLNAEDVYAGDVIELFGRTTFTGPYPRDFERVISVYQSAVPKNEGQRILLMR